MLLLVLVAFSMHDYAWHALMFHGMHATWGIFTFLDVQASPFLFIYLPTYLPTYVVCFLRFSTFFCEKILIYVATNLFILFFPIQFEILPGTAAIQHTKTRKKLLHTLPTAREAIGIEKGDAKFSKIPPQAKFIVCRQSDGAAKR